MVFSSNEVITFCFLCDVHVRVGIRHYLATITDLAVVSPVAAPFMWSDHTVPDKIQPPRVAIHDGESTTRPQL
jgi:hypothetical protein